MVRSFHKFICTCGHAHARRYGLWVAESDGTCGTISVCAYKHSGFVMQLEHGSQREYVDTYSYTEELYDCVGCTLRSITVVITDRGI